MLSICIPVYNFDVTGLVSALHQQISKLDYSCEMVCIDDYSVESYRIRNKEVCTRYGKYIELPGNIGRAKIRNLFLQQVKYNYLLYIDCDSIVASDDFLMNYIDLIKDESVQVICGGRIYDRSKPCRKKFLRWRYGCLKESMPVSVRKLNPNKSFMTNNFVIRKDLLDKIRFDERIAQYGHEDTLFGFQLKREKITITHADNPVLNGHLEDNDEFVAKTELGLRNLVSIAVYVNQDQELVKDITLLRIYQKCKEKHLTGIIVFLFPVLKLVLKLFLISGFAPLWVFDFYKLGYFARINRD